MLANSGQHAVTASAYVCNLGVRTADLGHLYWDFCLGKNSKTALGYVSDYVSKPKCVCLSDV